MAERARREAPARQPAAAIPRKPSGRGGQPHLSRPPRRDHHVRAISRGEVSDHMNRLVDRFGRTGFAALSSLIWALPMAAWAGSADLSPIDKTAYPWIALGIGLVMLVVWLVLLTRLGKVQVSTRQRRFDIQQMSRAEKRWTLGLAAFATGLIAWLNGAATVDWGPLISAVTAGKIGPTVLALGLAAFLVAMLACVWLSWSKESAAFHARIS